MKDRLNKYLKNIVEDYSRWTFVKKKPGEDEVKDKMFKEFADGLTIEDSPKRKWIRIVTDRNGINRSVHSFIVKNDCVANGKSWRKGDILKAASWNAPALNKPRGNIANPTTSSIRGKESSIIQIPPKIIILLTKSCCFTVE